MKELPLNFDYCALLTDILLHHVDPLRDIPCLHRKYCLHLPWATMEKS
jgi:hypothetical protein